MNVTCDACGEANAPELTFCLFCGAYLKWSDQAGETPAAVPVTQARTAEHSPADWRPRPEQPLEQTLVIPPVESVAPVPAASAPQVSHPISCPQCARVNTETRRFCVKCGYQFAGGPAVQRRAAPTSALRTWWGRVWDTEDRSARRAYRHSLPPLYRWRRVAVVLVVVSLLVGGGVVTKRQPLAWARDRWSDVFYAKRMVDVSVSSAAIAPATATLKDSDPAALVDNTADAWSTAWNVKSAAQPCPGKATLIELTFPPARVRQIVVIPGLADEKKRPTEFRPSVVKYAFDDGDPCHGESGTLQDSFQECAQNAAGACTITTDSKTQVRRLRIVVAEASKPQGKQARNRLSIAEIRIRQREK